MGEGEREKENSLLRFVREGRTMDVNEREMYG